MNWRGLGPMMTLERRTMSENARQGHGWQANVAAATKTTVDRSVVNESTKALEESCNC
jgi:hypothetical protein